ncbi:T4O12.19 [Arabidopsis thaliana]|uniref:T4O12.19 n=1 Tax=Arabidopsis thaliana TaxID=3702 RepID=Q9LQS0_ARATH|nr:T4O12.19 [Arabidopsis thaliana]
MGVRVFGFGFFGFRNLKPIRTRLNILKVRVRVRFGFFGSGLTLKLFFFFFFLSVTNYNFSVFYSFFMYFIIGQRLSQLDIDLLCTLYNRVFFFFDQRLNQLDTYRYLFVFSVKILIEI